MKSLRLAGGLAAVLVAYGSLTESDQQPEPAASQEVVAVPAVEPEEPAESPQTPLVPVDAPEAKEIDIKPPGTRVRKPAPIVQEPTGHYERRWVSRGLFGRRGYYENIWVPNTLSAEQQERLPRGVPCRRGLFR